MYTQLYWDYLPLVEAFCAANPAIKKPELLAQIVSQCNDEFEDLNRKFGAVRPSRRTVSSGGGGGVGLGLTKEIKVTMNYIAPPTVQAQEGVDIGEMPWTIELPAYYSAWILMGVGLKVSVMKSGSPITSPQQPSVTFIRVGSVKSFTLRSSVFLKFGFYSNTAPAIAPPESGDEGKFFLRFTQGSITDEWKSSFVFLSGGTLTDYANSLIDVHMSGLIAMMGV